MTDRPIIFSGPMVCALLDGRKTQTRRLATSPLRNVEVGDRIYVRESWRTHRAYDDLSPSEMGGEERVWFDADRDNCDQHGRRRASMHMPRWASRLTLLVIDKRVQRLRSCSAADAIAEGILVGEPLPEVPGSFGDIYHDGVTDPIDGWTRSPIEAYATLWDSLHTKPGERWEDNPEVVAITFEVMRANIDNLGAAT